MIVLRKALEKERVFLFRKKKATETIKRRRER
jgi:hypothetical protein